jgi:hypothetical protein
MCFSQDRILDYCPYRAGADPCVKRFTKQSNAKPNKFY